MPQVESIYAKWNPWHGCTEAQRRMQILLRLPAGRDVRHGRGRLRLPQDRELRPARQKKKRDGSWKLPSGKVIFTCFTSDFLLSDADPWRQDCWDMIRRRQDCFFYFFTKRIDRLSECLPPGWGGGYETS